MKRGESYRMVKVTLIRPRYFSVWESLACGYIGSYLKRYLKEPLELQFYDGFFDTDEDIIKGSADSDYVGFSCTSPQMKHALFLASEIKTLSPRVTTVFGGHHPSSLPKETEQLPNVDVVVVGEGEAGMFMVVDQARIEGIAKPALIDNLDAIPFPDRKLIRQERTLALTEKNDSERIASILTGRGCPFHCIFCSGDHDVFGPYPRKRSVRNVLNEVEELVDEWKIDMLKFVDTEINTSLDWIDRFCKEKIKRHIRVPWGANIHAGLTTKRMLETMASSNCREIWVGVETGSPRILSQIHKALTMKAIEDTFKWARAAGIRTRAYFMVGFPNETRKDFEMTLEFAERLDPDVVGMTVICPYPGTKLYDPLRFGDVDWSSQDEYANSVWSTENFTNEDLKSMQAEFTDKFKDRLCFRQKVKEN